ncbi:MAG TPA: sugar phosphate isomerase/epimerase family protein [Thermodesulfovibrionales bacterium]|nr:sugar phosphate isomerase/epimerase family protein [Thermodesulfovibrionales bacterium]
MSKVHVHIPYDKIGKYLPLLRKERLNLEIYFSAASLDSLRDGSIEALKHSLEYKPSLSMHAPFMDLSPGAVDSKIRTVTVERFSQVLGIAEVLRPETIVFHSGYEKWKYAHRIDLWLEGSLKTWRPFIEKAARLNLKLAIENIFEDEPSNLQALMKELSSQNFGICFDTGHCNLFSKVPLREWLDTLGSFIVELHLHDNDKSFDAHLPVGDGTFDFETLFAATRERECVYTIEAHTPERVLKSIERLKRFTRVSPSGFSDETP